MVTKQDKKKKIEKLSYENIGQKLSVLNVKGHTCRGLFGAKYAECDEIFTGPERRRGIIYEFCYGNSCMPYINILQPSQGPWTSSAEASLLLRGLYSIKIL